jgi:crotonobetainyl-CoA:carnitine CoA-transferase CaiB-like acyl-CoA transferase
VDVSLLQTGFHLLGNDVATALVTREPVRRHDRRNTFNPLWNSYPTRDGRWLLLVMIDPDRYWPKLCAALERPAWAVDERWQDGFARARNAAALVAELEVVFRTRELAEWRPVLDAAGLIWAPVNRIDEAIDDPQAHALGYFYELEHETAGRFLTAGPPFRIEGVELGARRAARPFHADAEAVLREAGLSPEEIEKLV